MKSSFQTPCLTLSNLSQATSFFSSSSTAFSTFLASALSLHCLEPTVNNMTVGKFICVLCYKQKWALLFYQNACVRQLRKLQLPPTLLMQFYYAIIESVLTLLLAVWFGSCTSRQKPRASSAHSSQDCHQPGTSCQPHLSAITFRGEISDC